MPASRMRALARTSRCPMVAGGIRKAEAMSSAVMPRMVWRISGARMPRSMAGWRAREHQREAPVGDRLTLLGSGFDLIGDHLDVLLPDGAGLAAADGVGLPPARHGQQPRGRIGRHAIGRPHAEGRGKGFRQGILGARHVARAGSEKGDEAAVAFAGHALGSPAGLVGMLHFRLPVCSTIGRISIDPYLLDGQRLAQAMASSRSGTVTKK